MGERGPPPTPTALKIARGNPGHRPLNHQEPTPRIGMPQMPPYLTELGQEVYPQFGAMLHGLRVLTEADGWALGQLSESYADGVRARRVLETVDRYPVTVGKSGAEYVSRHPAVMDAAEADKRFAMWCRRFGLDPASRSQVKVVAPPETGDARRKRFFGDKAG